jgi:hypothetical protein
MKRVIAEVPEAAIVSGPGRPGRGADDDVQLSHKRRAARITHVLDKFKARRMGDFDRDLSMSWRSGQSGEYTAGVQR